jgi:hypothetical protein
MARQVTIKLDWLQQRPTSADERFTGEMRWRLTFLAGSRSTIARSFGIARLARFFSHHAFPSWASAFALSYHISRLSIVVRKQRTNILSLRARSFGLTRLTYALRTRASAILGVGTGTFGGTRALRERDRRCRLICTRAIDTTDDLFGRHCCCGEGGVESYSRARVNRRVRGGEGEDCAKRWQEGSSQRQIENEGNGQKSGEGTSARSPATLKCQPIRTEGMVSGARQGSEGVSAAREGCRDSPDRGETKMVR